MFKITKISFLVTLLVIVFSASSFAEQQKIKVGMGAILSGDLAVFGKADAQAAELYLKHFSRHDIELIIEDAGLSSSEGLSAYQKLISHDKVDVLIAAGTSNGIMAAKGLIDSSETPTFMASTGGDNIDKASPWVFRTGNSDTLNGIQQAEYFLENNIKKVALLTELTEYTTDISRFFRERFEGGGGKLVYDDNFLPNTPEFRTQISSILRSKAQAVFMPTQTGTALGIFVKQLRQQEKENALEVHTTMVAGPNPDAHTIAGKHILGVRFMDPNYDPEGVLYQTFIKLYRDTYSEEPAAPFHVAAVLDTIELIQKYLDENEFNPRRFQKFITEDLGKVCGYMGCYEIDSEGNSNLGFHSSVIEKLL